MSKPYSTTSQVLNQALATLIGQAKWNTSEPGKAAVADITYTALAWSQVPVTVAYVAGGTAGAEVVTVTAQAIVVKLQAGVSTATQVLAAIVASAAASALVSAAITGTAGTAQVATTSPTQIIGDVCLRIMEADNEVDTRLAGMGYSLPFAVNPPAVQDLSVLYARYACMRDAYTGSNPQANSESAKVFLSQFEAKLMAIKAGEADLVDASGQTVPKSKYTPLTAPYPCPQPMRDNYPNYPQGPYPDLPGVDSY